MRKSPRTDFIIDRSARKHAHDSLPVYLMATGVGCIAVGYITRSFVCVLAYFVAMFAGNRLVTLIKRSHPGGKLKG